MIPCLILACQHKLTSFAEYGLNYGLKKLSSDNTQSISAMPLHFSQKPTPESLFALFADTPWAMWLDSNDSSHVDSQFDIMVWQPEVTLSTQAKTTTIDWKNNSKKTTSDLDPLLLVEQVKQQVFANITVDQGHLPFYGGALGYFAYDLGHRFEKLPSTAEKDIALPEMALGIYTQAIIYDRQQNEFFLVCPQQKRESISQFIIEQQSTTQQTATSKIDAFQLTSQWQANIDQASYQEKFNKIQEYLLSGDCYQINLTQRFTAQYQGNEFHAYLALRKANKAPFSAFLRFSDNAILSVSPERFLKLSNNKVQSKPIKGTIVRSEDSNQDQANAHKLAQSTKDKAENLMIVDLLRNDISRVCLPGTVKVPKLFAIESFPAVHHLVSTVEGELDAQFNACDLLRASFPGGSITGAPKIRAMEIIDELEPQRRSIYCGSIGYISACGNMDTSITIRTLVCKNNNIYCWAGGGIVADSQVEAEYQESFDKVNKVLPVLSKL